MRITLMLYGWKHLHLFMRYLGFEDGWVTVQDASAQGCMTRLAPQNGEHILDLCAAPRR